MKIKSDYVNEPKWKELTIKSRLPEKLKCLDELAHNMWWGWNYEARNMFKCLDEKLYEEVGHNPVLLLERLSYDRKVEIVNDTKLMKKIKDVYAKFTTYMNVKPDANRPSVGNMVSTRCSRFTPVVSVCWLVTTSRRLLTVMLTSVQSVSSIASATSLRV